MNKVPVYLNSGTVVAESGSVRIYNYNDKLYMENKPGVLISYDDKRKDYIWQLSDRPFGRVLVLGLGLGLSAKYIFSLPRVRDLVVMEEDSDVIKTTSMVQPHLEFYTIVKVDNYLEAIYKDNSIYDFIFLDCYNKIDNATLPIIADLINACKKKLSSYSRSALVGWLPESTPEILIETFFDLFSLK